MLSLGRQPCLVLEARGRVVLIHQGRDLEPRAAQRLGRVVRALGCGKLDLVVLAVRGDDLAGIRNGLGQWLTVGEVWDGDPEDRRWGGEVLPGVPGLTVKRSRRGELVVVFRDGGHTLLFTAGASDSHLGVISRQLGLGVGDLVIHPHPQAHARRQQRLLRGFGLAGVVVAGGAVSRDARRVFNHRLVTPDGSALRLTGRAGKSWTLERWGHVGGETGWLPAEWRSR